MTDLLVRTLVHEDLQATPPTEPRSALSGSVAETLALAVAPSTGRFRPLPRVAERAGTAWSQRVGAGQLLGHVTGGRGRADEVRSPSDARLCALLVRAGQLVSRGQGLVWLQRDEVVA
jgi:biotin carboxyl carrier protein